jgi:hypothetical protein
MFATKESEKKLCFSRSVTIVSEAVYRLLLRKPTSSRPWQELGRAAEHVLEQRRLKGGDLRLPESQPPAHALSSLKAPRTPPNAGDHVHTLVVISASLDGVLRSVREHRFDLNGERPSFQYCLRQALKLCDRMERWTGVALEKVTLESDWVDGEVLSPENKATIGHLGKLLRDVERLRKFLEEVECRGSRLGPKASVQISMLHRECRRGILSLRRRYEHAFPS